MDKRNSRKNEQTEKKVEKKDRGDLNKDKQNKKLVDSDTKVKITHPEGDTDKKADNTKSVLTKIVEDAKKNEEQLIKRVEKAVADIIQNNNNVDKEDKRKRDKYASKLKSPNVSVPIILGKREEGAKISLKSNLDANKTERQMKKPLIAKEKADSPQNSKGSFHKERLNREANQSQRRPIIKTITSENDASKIFKAVTFVEQKKNKPAAIEVKIPNEKLLGNNKNYKTSDTKIGRKVNASPSKVILEKSILKKRGEKRRKKRQVTSPDLSARVKSPSTEVAKWAPSSINHHTKPYYEAWVNTTLAAISKTSKKDKLFLEKQNILQNFQRTLTVRPDTPDLLYENFTDERYTGRIKVKRR